MLKFVGWCVVIINWIKYCFNLGVIYKDNVFLCDVKILFWVSVGGVIGGFERVLFCVKCNIFNFVLVLG